ncbi:MAG: IspD/TarI family cytidylyltransferase [Chlamydiales bacterium]
MYEGKTIGAVLLMGGQGLRFGSEVPKQFHLLGETMIYCYPLDTLIRSALFDEIVLVCPPNRMDIPEDHVAKGGATRQESSYLGILAFKQRPDIVLIHDAVRPFVTLRILKDNVEGAVRWGAVDTCIPSADTLVYAPYRERIESIPIREHYLRGQTPQTFRMDWILEAHERALADGIKNASDDCSLVLRLGKQVHIVAGDETNIKITSEFDLAIAKNLLKIQAAREKNKNL